MNKSTSRLCLEKLENRWNPAGTVKGTLSGGTWTLTGDDAANSITINSTATPNQFHLVGNATTIAGVQDPTGVKNIVVKFAAGADDVTLNAGGTPGKLMGSLTVNGGSEANLVSVNGMTIGANVSITNASNAVDADQFNMNNSNVLGKVTIANGDGDTSLNVDGNAAGSSFIGKGLSVTNGKGADTAYLTDYNIGVSTTFRNGLPGAGDLAGTTQLATLSNSTSRSVITGNLSVSYLSGRVSGDILSDYEIAGNVTLDYGTGQSEMSIDGYNINQPVVIRGSLSIIATGTSKMFLGCGTGNSNNYPFKRSGLTVGKNLNLNFGNSGSTLNLDRVNVGGATKISTGSAVDTINIDDSSFRGFQLLTGLGDDVVKVEQKTGTAANTQFLGKTKVDLGGGLDTFTLGSAADSSRQVEFFGLASLSGGKDTDFDTINRDNIVWVFAEPSYTFDNVI